MKNSKLILAVFCVIATVSFWYLGRPPAPPPQENTAENAVAPKTAAMTEPLRASSQNKSEGTASSPTAEQRAAHAVAPQSDALNQGSVSPPVPQIGTPAPPPDAPPVLEPEQKLEALRLMFRNYGQRFRGNPVGNNAEITSSLKGRNPGNADYLADGIHAINDKGELCDAWGTPYFFHQLSGTEMEIRSAGPDKKMWTSDDLVIK
jgi:hypothetical protein